MRIYFSICVKNCYTLTKIIRMFTILPQEPLNHTAMARREQLYSL